MPPRDREVVQHDVVVGGAADRGRLPVQVEDLLAPFGFVENLKHVAKKIIEGALRRRLEQWPKGALSARRE